MNTIARKTSSFVTVALTAAIGAVAALHSFDIGSAGAKPGIVKLERVVVIGKRAEPSNAATQVARIEQLPRVVIEGRRADASVQVASACVAPAMC